jgi:hypothetical protein
MQLDATYEGPEAVQRRQISETMGNPVFLAQVEAWAKECEACPAADRNGMNALAAALRLWAWTRDFAAAAKDAAGKKLGASQRHGVVFPMADALAGLMAAIPQAFNDDDDERNWAEKYLGRATANVLDNLNPFGMIPYISEILGLMQGYNVERADMSVATTLVKYTGSFVNKIANGQELTMKVTADAGQIRALTKAVHAVDMAAVQPGRIAMQLDAGEIDAEYARGLMAMLVRDLETAQQNFAEAEPSGLPAEALNGLMRHAVAALQPLTADSVPAAQLTGRMRCAGLSVWFAREDWIKVIEAKVPPKTVEINTKAFLVGYEK